MAWQSTKVAMVIWILKRFLLWNMNPYLLVNSIKVNKPWKPLYQASNSFLVVSDISSQAHGKLYSKNLFSFFLLLSYRLISSPYSRRFFLQNTPYNLSTFLLKLTFIVLNYLSVPASPGAEVTGVCEALGVIELGSSASV